ncbi:MAG: hypothetical protein ACPL4H_04955 [Anaerolineales bacterium]
MSHPIRLMVIGFLLSLIGWLFPLLMVIRVIEPTFTLSFLSYAASVSGLFLGIIGAASYIRTHRK